MRVKRESARSASQARVSAKCESSASQREVRVTRKAKAARNGSHALGEERIDIPAKRPSYADL